MRHIRNHHALAAIGAAALLLAAAVPAQAALASTTRTVVTPMSFGGFDAAAAKAQGFELQTVNGRTVPVPVTAEAKREWAEASADEAAIVHPDGTVEGNCGSSTVTAVYNGGNTIRVVTSYVVKAPAVDHAWFVDESLVATGTKVHQFNFSGLSTGRLSWTSDPQISPAIRDTQQGGSTQVTLGSHAVLLGGFVCYSGGPIDVF
ncbi:hypothetical protein ACR8AL_05025 [Clavibacter sepedonicus]|nr:MULTISPECIES: hypothetical protein [Clavibacter]MBD5382251.1 hypothetical protein [Clavibacter sp.]UUK65571.1 hypothetical protein LRE50_15085 [Clavibacter sepedonicus]